MTLKKGSSLEQSHFIALQFDIQWPSTHTQSLKEYLSKRIGSANPVLRRSPRHTENLEDLLLALALNQLTLRDLRSPLPSHDIRIQAMLIQSHALLARQKPNRPIEDVVPSEIDQRSTKLVARDE